jgi:hypothetical protein
MARRVPAKPGDRIRLVKMDFDPNPVAVGALGTVRAVADIGVAGKVEFHIAVDWDDGRTLSLVCPEDKFEIVVDRSLPF